MRLQEGKVVVELVDDVRPSWVTRWQLDSMTSLLGDTEHSLVLRMFER